ncbi:hypothetical protein [Methylobacterium sp. WL6]|uniref:hypothetical protein n=1 Tax=Methylobacterium sp. WL6 TaxID=2603901 RepID=UPI0011C70122|nr:hypothetical protein [Methylobacterium sp. WL6]TXN72384.1 hypothetical protein FV230_04995 [Methylobacterium sp. WL6]
MTAPTPHRAASAEERERHEPTDAEMQAEIAAEEAARKASLPRAVAPIPVRARYFLMECEHCGWVGSSELCGTDSGGDDSDIYCPACDAITLGDEPSEADAAKFGQALLDRITAAEARAEGNHKGWTAALGEAQAWREEHRLATADRDRLADEVARLRGALAAIADACPATCEMTVAHDMADVAARALTVTGGTTDGQRD